MNEQQHKLKTMKTKTATPIFSKRIGQVPRSFIRDILKAAVSPGVISFAGGLPNAELFPAKGILKATQKVLQHQPERALQYSNTEGLPELRRQISQYYHQKGMEVPIENILITTGSQQAIDLLGKVFIDKDDTLVMEEPGYLGAIQAFAMYEPQIVQVPLLEDGIDPELFEHALSGQQVKLAYLIPKFQNPSGISYTEQRIQAVAQIARQRRTYIVEDNPYGDLSYDGKSTSGFYHYLPEQTIMLGTFSKTVVPGFRIGWVVAPADVYEQLVKAKQAADLHTDVFAQSVLSTYLFDTPLEEHLNTIREAYKQKAQTMIAALEQHMPAEVTFTRPHGGMFLWMTLPEGTSSMELFQLASKRGVAFVPGFPFYANASDSNSLRLNFTCSSEAQIEKGVHILAESLKLLNP